MKRTLLLLLLLAAPLPAAAQSLFGTRRLGVPIDPLDARARALGGIGVGLLGINTSLINPAEFGGMPRRGVSAALQPSSSHLSSGDAADDVASSRFPLLAIIYPATPRLTVTLGYAGYLEQSWGIHSSGTLQVDTLSVAYQDVIKSTGGIGQIRLGGAYLLNERLSLGAATGVITGNLDRLATRTFTDASSTLHPFTARERWEYNGFFGSVGARFDVNARLRVGASALLTTDIDADSAEGTAQTRSYAGGMQLAAGASGQLTRDLVLALGAIRQAYPSATRSGETARDTWTVGGGIEYEGLRSGRRTFPFRLGARLQQFPYYAADETPAREVSGSAGLGFRLAGDEAGPLAVVDVGIERAQRTGLRGSALSAGLDESLWRLTFSLALFGR